MTGLEELREEIADVDARIMGLVAKRMSLAEDIGEEKRRLGLPVRVPEVEERVVARYRSFAESHGIDPDSAEKLARALIEESVRLQNGRGAF